MGEVLSGADLCIDEAYFGDVPDTSGISSQSLRLGLAEGSGPKAVDPETCDIWAGNTRDCEALKNSSSYAELRDSIRLTGQQVAVIARVSSANPKRLEVIAGASRLTAIREINSTQDGEKLLLLVEVREMTDDEAFRLVSGENIGRAVAALRAKRSPRVTAPRVVNGVTLLPASIAKCGCCDTGLTVRTGKGGRYHYYCCSARVNQGAGACDLPAMRREQLDRVVIDALTSRLFHRDRLVPLLQHLLDRSEETKKRRRKDLALAKAELTNVTKAITNLLLAIESGVMRPDEAVFAERMAHNRARKTALEADMKSLEAQLASAKVRISETMIGQFGEHMQKMIRNGDPVFRSAYVRLFVERVEVGPEEIRIMGTKAVLERALITSDGTGLGQVPIFDREWCPGEDSNLHALASAST